MYDITLETLSTLRGAYRADVQSAGEIHRALDVTITSLSERVLRLSSVSFEGVRVGEVGLNLALLVLPPLFLFDFEMGLFDLEIGLFDLEVGLLVGAHCVVSIFGTLVRFKAKFRDLSPDASGLIRATLFIVLRSSVTRLFNLIGSEKLSTAAKHPVIEIKYALKYASHYLLTYESSRE